MKKMISLFAAAVAMVVMMSACSVHGTPAGLVGTWKMTEYDGVSAPSNQESLIRIDADDSLWNKYSYPGYSSDWAHGSDIIKCTCNEITTKSLYGEKKESTVKYELSCNDLSITNDDDKVTKYVRQ